MLGIILSLSLREGKIRVANESDGACSEPQPYMLQGQDGLTLTSQTRLLDTSLKILDGKLSWGSEVLHRSGNVIFGGGPNRQM